MIIITINVTGILEPQYTGPHHVNLNVTGILEPQYTGPNISVDELEGSIKGRYDDYHNY